MEAHASPGWDRRTLISALPLDEGAYFFRAGKDKVGPVPSHAPGYKGRGSLRWAVFGIIGFETKVRLPELMGFPVHGRYIVAVGAVGNALNQDVGPKVFQIGPALSLHSAGGFSSAAREAFQERDQVGPLGTVFHAAKNHPVARDQSPWVGQPLIEGLFVPYEA